MAFSPKSLVEVIQHNRTKKIAVGKIIESNPQALPIIPKLLADHRNVARQGVEIDKMQMNRGILETIHHQIESNRQNNKNIIKLFPDMEMCIQILVSSILSPKKMTEIELLYRFNKKIPNSSPEISAAVLSAIKEYVTETHELEENLPEIVREALFTSGSYCMAVVPEASVDELINSDLVASFSTEAFRAKADVLVSALTDGINLRGSGATTPALPASATPEEFVRYLASEHLLKVTDNTGLFRFAEMKEKITGQMLKRSYKTGRSVATESVEKIEYLDIFRRRDQGAVDSNVRSLKLRDEAARKSIGTPMVVRIPSQSTVPVSVPGNETDHIGYLVLLDENGKPLSAETSYDGRDSGDTPGYGNMSAAGQTPVQVAYRNLVADNSAKVNSGELFNMYRDILENQLYSSIRSTLSGKEVSIDNKNDIFFLMFSRALAGQRTSVLFIPQQLMVYFSFYHDEKGVGKSILDNLSILCSLRSILLFARVMAQAKNAIDVTKVNISLSPEDPDPEKTIQTVQDGVLKLRQNFFPLGINNPVDLINWIQRAGLQFAYSNNPLLPDVQIDFESAAISHDVPDGDLEESLRKQTFQALGLPPEVVDNAFSPEFATNVVNNNVLLSKRVMVYQKALSKDLSKLVGMFVYSDEELRGKLREVLDKHKEALYTQLTEVQKQSYTKNFKEFIEEYLDTLSENLLVELPKPENTNLTNLAEEFNIYKEGLDNVIDSVISSEIFSQDVAGSLSEHIDTVRNIYKHYLLRQWCANNNYYPEVMSFGASGKEEVKAMIATITGQLTDTMSNSTGLLTIMQKFKQALERDMMLVSGEGGEASQSSSSSSDSGDLEEYGGGEEDGGMDDMDDSLDF